MSDEKRMAGEYEIKQAIRTKEWSVDMADTENRSYPEYLMRILREQEGLDENDRQKDSKIQTLYSPDEVFDCFLQYEGYGSAVYTLKSKIQDIYGIELTEKKPEIWENAGYRIIDSIGVENAEFVIGERIKGEAPSYVTWQCKNGSDYFWGHYGFDSMMKARKDLYQRAVEAIDTHLEYESTVQTAALSPENIPIENKMIRFVDVDRTALFELSDGGYLEVQMKHGGIAYRQCHYMDDTHFFFGESFYETQQFAIAMKAAQFEMKPYCHPELSDKYTITDKTVIGRKVFAIAHNPAEKLPFVTMEGLLETPGIYHSKHSFNKKSEARRDYKNRISPEKEKKGFALDIKGSRFNRLRIKKPKKKDRER